ncbi:APC family permease [Nonomuraea jabiensis]|uniref:APC family permease n=1 Tax=Nonomuraea jabiensis TaxID=882448 RepID=UPI00368BF82B
MPHEPPPVSSPAVAEAAPRRAGEAYGSAPTLAQGRLGVAHIVFMVVAAAAPAAGTVAILPIAIALGVGVGTPGSFVLMAVVLLFFAVGFSRMAPHVGNAGAFFAYITKGLGRVFGLAAAYVAIVSYVCIAAATTGALGFFAGVTAQEFFGIDVAWWVWALAGLIVIGILGYFRVTVAAGVLGVSLVLEALAVLVLDIAILVQRGPGAFSLEVFEPSKALFAGAAGISLMYAFSCFQGFESTAIYAEEARTPRTTVPRATYAAVVLISLFFVLTSWAMLVGGGMERAPATAGADLGGYAYNLTTEFVGSAWTKFLEVLIVTSSFAGVLAFHNAVSRYFFALSREGLLPTPLSKVHPRHHSPTVAGFLSFGLITAIVVGFAVAGLDPLTNLVTSLTSVGALGLLSLVTLTSISVVVFFARRGEFGWVHTVAPVLAAVALGVCAILALANYEAVTGTTSTVINNLPWILVVVVAAAVIVANWTRVKDPERYARMGSTRIE